MVMVANLTRNEPQGSKTFNPQVNTTVTSFNHRIGEVRMDKITRNYMLPLGNHLQQLVSSSKSTVLV